VSSIVRKAEPHDFEALFGLVANFATSFTPDREAFEQNAKAIMDDEAAWLVVVEQEGEMIGYCLGFDHFTFYANGRVAWVEEIMVKDGYRQQGIGRNLMLGFEAWAKERGAKLVALATRRAAPFYQALGYEDSATYFRKLL
jgi:GNAT superfamily N-acetyltransferase